MSLLLLFNGPTTLPPPPANLTVYGFGHPAILGLGGDSTIGPLSVTAAGSGTFAGNGTAHPTIQ